MKSVSIGLLGLIGVLSWGSRPGVAQEQEPPLGERRVIVDETGAFVDADTGQRLTPEEAAAAINRATQTETEPDRSPEEPVETPPPLVEESGEEFGGIPAETGTEFSEEAPASLAGETALRSRPPAPQPPREPTRGETSAPPAETLDAEALLSSLLASEESTAGSETGPPSRTPPSTSSLLPPNSPASKLIQDSHFALDQARLIAGPQGRWLTLNQALRQRYREADIRALLREYAQARQAWRRGDEAGLRQSLARFIERLERMNAAAGQAPGAMPDNGGLDLEALRKRLEAEGKATAERVPQGPSELPPPGPKRWLWPLLGGGLVLTLLGIGLALRQARQHRGATRLQVKGKVLAVRGPEAGEIWTVAGERVVLGTGRDCDVVLTDRGLAPHHAVLTREADGLHIANLDPVYGTRVNGRPITEALLHNEDMIEMGQTTLTFEGEEE